VRQDRTNKFYEVGKKEHARYGVVRQKMPLGINEKYGQIIITIEEGSKDKTVRVYQFD
jgi:hypothetical protein